jgi:import receptor subunit TOM20
MAAAAGHHKLLFTLEPLSAQVMPEVPPEIKAKRHKTQEDLAAYLKDHKSQAPNLTLLACRAMASHFTQEIDKFMGPSSGEPPADSQKDAKYTLEEHLDRLRYVASPVPHSQLELVRSVLSTAFIGLQDYFSQNRVTILINKVTFNSIGIVYSGGRSDKVVFLQPEGIETRA